MAEKALKQGLGPGRSHMDRDLQLQAATGGMELWEERVSKKNRTAQKGCLGPRNRGHAYEWGNQRGLTPARGP